MWTQGDVKSHEIEYLIKNHKKIEYLSQLFLFRSETLWNYVHCDISMAS